MSLSVSPRMCVICGVLLLATAAAVFPAYWLVLNKLGPSTEYHEPYVEGAAKLADGQYAAYVGDVVYVRYTIVRHKINGNCLLDVRRYGEFVGGARDGERRMLDHVELRFKGANELLRPRWPLDGFRLTDDLVPPGEDQQKLALYVVARYHCNVMDGLIPRYIQGGDAPDQTERVYLTVKRREK